MRPLVLCFCCLLAALALFAQKKQDTVAAHYPGGQGAWLRYVNQHLRVPATASNQSGSATFVFHVSDKGNITNIRMIKGDTLLRKTFTDLFTNSVPWVPAKFNERAVHSTRTFFMTYHLERE